MKNSKEDTEIPAFGLKLKLDHKYPEIRSQESFTKPKTIWLILSLFIRYLIYHIICKLTKKSVVINLLHPRQSECIYGVPIGGIGSGTIGRGFRGEFCRFQMRPGIYEWNTVEANQFILTIRDENQHTIFQSLLSTFPRRTLKAWKNLIDGARCTYTALYPRSWTEFDLSEYGIILLCRQMSPILPHNYEDSSLPCAVFEWDVKNVGQQKRTVTITFTFKNGTGNGKEDKAFSCNSKPFIKESTEGIIMNHTIDAMPCSYVIATERSTTQEISKCLYFDPNSDGAEPWIQLDKNGHFEEVSTSHSSVVNGEMGCGLAVKMDVDCNTSDVIKFNLVWDMPIIHFGSNRKRKYRRKYTEMFLGENAAVDISHYAFQNYRKWERCIHKWQSSVLNDKELPRWFKGALFNQLYYISDGGASWLLLDNEELERMPDNDPRRKYGRFAYLESHEYIMYNSYDVHFYASFAFNMNWPNIQKIIQYDIRDSIFKEILTKKVVLATGNIVPIKTLHSVPHDLGNPAGEPFIGLNAMIFHDTSEWKDLNSKFVLQVLRDASRPHQDQIFDNEYLEDMYEACYIVTMKLSQFDRDGDGLIENDGIADQTYDTWPMKGPSAYCGGLWLAAVFGMANIAKRLNKREDQRKFEEILEKGKQAFQEKLWNGLYYNFDDRSPNEQNKCIMSDQLCGHWYLRCCGFEYEVFPKKQVESSLRTIFANNVKSFCDGKLGAVNGFIDGGPDVSALFSKEVWTGVTYSIASTMIFEGMLNEGFETAEGLFEAMTHKFGLSFDYPEAVEAEKYYRGVGYSRPLSIWAMYLAFQSNKSIA